MKILPDPVICGETGSWEEMVCPVGTYVLMDLRKRRFLTSPVFQTLYQVARGIETGVISELPGEEVDREGGTHRSVGRL